MYDRASFELLRTRILTQLCLGIPDLTEIGVPTSGNGDRPLDAALADMANNVCGILEGGLDPVLVAFRLGSLGWSTRSASWCSYEAETAWCRIEIDQTDDGATLVNGVIAPQRIDDLATLLTGLGRQHSLELSDENDDVVEERRH
ncbi:hypothetical protein [Streptomyces sp. NPDC000229]|uniref:hypothetical protein n=1 Tax=Streptomyces sp. NPDC000229 TaxID=3154247 RepID=UPI0033172466